MLVFKIDIMSALMEAGYNPARLRKEKLIGEKTIQDMKTGIVPGKKTMDTLCKILDKQPGDFLEYVAQDTKNSVTYD